jgi:phosphatidylinositol phosphate synthase
VWSAFPVARWTYRAPLAFAAGLGRAGVTANQLTVLSLLLAIGSGIAIACSSPWLALAGLVSSGLSDALDGMVARAAGTSSRAGALLDSVLDRLSDAAPLTGILVLATRQEEPTLATVPAVAMVGGFTVSYVRARAESLGTALPPLYARRAERMVVVAVGIALGAWFELDGAGFGVLLASNVLLAIASLFGAAHALVIARRALSRAADPPRRETSGQPLEPRGGPGWQPAPALGPTRLTSPAGRP